MSQTTSRVNRRSGRLSSNTDPASLLGLVEAAVPLEDGAGPSGQPASGTSGESTSRFTSRLGSKGGGGRKPSIATNDRGRLVNDEFLQATCLAKVGLNGAVCGTPQHLCSVLSHRRKPNEPLPKGAILSVSGKVNGEQVSLSTAKFVLPEATDSLSSRELNQVLQQGDRHRTWNLIAKGGYIDIQHLRKEAMTTTESGRAAVKPLLKKRPTKQAAYEDESDEDSSSLDSDDEYDSAGNWR
ncbi:hypothetical protein THAOC_29596, partial [Thalassiosira oceanica]